MSSFSRVALRPRPLLLASTYLASTCLISIATIDAARAQQADVLPTIDVTATRITDGIAGAATSVITAEEIRRSPAATIQDIIAQTPGVQVRSLYGSDGGVNTSVDLRGFGATGTSNTLVLINGRRLNDLDLAGVDFSTVPRDSIERIEVTRGNSGAVLYGDNAVGGVINIVTKKGVTGPPTSIRVEGGGGSFGQRNGSVSATTNTGKWSTSVFANAFTTNGYRKNNEVKQGNAAGEIRYTDVDFSSFLNLSVDNQHIGFPGGRIVDPSIGVNQLVTDRRGTSTPFDFGNKQGANATAGFTKTIINGVELIVDGGVRNKQQQATFYSTFGNSAIDTVLQTWSLTPRLRITTPMFGLTSTILTGIDFGDAGYGSNRSQALGGTPSRIYDLSQRTIAGYWQQTIAFAPTTDFSYGGRIQQTQLSARDTVNTAAPGGFGAVAAIPLQTTGTNQAFHVGIDHRLNDTFAVFARAASAFRTPNVDERVASGPSSDPITFAPIPRTFTLKTQTSNDVEGGFRVKAGALNVQSSVYAMNTNNELQYDAVQFFNRNLDPIRRYGSETSADFRASDTVLVRGAVALTRATFREGAYAGQDVPLVSHFTASAGVTWNIWQNYLVLDATARYWSERRMANDNANVQPVIPANATVDLKLSGVYDRYFWSASVINLFDAQYYDYAVASSFTPGRFSAYPLPGRTFLLKAGITF
jgi:iron complex outermembrane receptor protein